MALGSLERLLKVTATGRRPHFPVVPDGNTGWFEFGGTELDSIYNRTRGGAQGGAKIGTQASFDETYASLRSTLGYIQTGVDDTASYTYILVCRSFDTQVGATTRPSFIASRPAGSSAGVGGGMGVVISSAAAPSVTMVHRVAIQSSLGVVSVLPTGGLTVSDITEWTVLLASYDATSRIARLKNLVTGTAAASSAAAAGSTRVLSAEPVSIGTDPVTGASGTLHAERFCSWNRVLTSEEEGAELAEIRTLLEDLKGITI